MEKFKHLAQQLSELEAADMLRRLRCVSSAHGPVVRFVGDEREKVLFCSNNYLNIAGDPAVADSVCQAVRRDGFGGGASRLVSGTMRGHVEVERRFAEFFGTESALLFPSGWTANESVIKTIPQKGDIVLMDKLAHASIVDAARAGGAEFRTYRRDNLAKLAKLLAINRNGRKYIVTESVFSMDGDVADLVKLVKLKKAYDAVLIVDEAHAVGCMGANGAGLSEELGVLGEVDIVIAPLGKAFGAAGGVVASRQTAIDYLVNKARAFIYTTAVGQGNCAAILAGLEIVKAEPGRRETLGANAEYLRGRLCELGLDIGNSSTHIIPVIIGEAKEAVRVSDELYERGFFVAAIRPPTVAAGTARLRISVQSGHTKEQLDGLVEALAAVI
jgi:8-amino-7-oxononanoate synthase